MGDSQRRKHRRDDDDDGVFQEERDKRYRRSSSPQRRDIDRDRNAEATRDRDNRGTDRGRGGPTKLFQASLFGAVRGGSARDRRGEDKSKTTDEINIVTSKPEIKEVFTNPDVINRNKRLFGSLMGHLGSAQSKLERDSEAIKRQTERIHEVAKKNAEESKRLEALKKQEARKAAYDAKVSMIKTSFETWKSHIEPLSNFIFTEIEPRLAWLPAHHNKTTKEILNRRQEEVTFCLIILLLLLMTCFIFQQVLRCIAEKELEVNEKLIEIENLHGSAIEV